MKNKGYKKKVRFLLFLLLLLVLFFICKLFFTNTFFYNENVVIREGDSFQTFLSDLKRKDKLQIKLYVKNNKINMNTIAVGNYVFSGNFSPKNFVDLILEGPKVLYHTIRILEGWSIYDIDKYLLDSGLISEGDYISFVQDDMFILKYKQRYDFLPENIRTLEGFLYPDTYKVDVEKNVVDQLVYLQLETFNKRVWNNVSNISPQIGLDRYKSIIMASIVEKEEKSEENRPTVAGVLIKRLQIGMFVGADISLCYFYKIPYSECTPSFIAKNVFDKFNPYNTRTVIGLPPTPVGNPTYNSILASLQPKYTEYLYYLHDADGKIHYAKNLEQHNSNKLNYLK